MQVLTYLFIGIIMGMFFPIQASLSARLTSHAKTPLTASFFAFVLGSVILLVVNLLIDSSGIIGGIDFSYPLYVFIGGALAGVGFNVANIVLFSKLGASVTTLLTVTGQMVIGILIDNFGWFGVQIDKINLTKSLGIIIMLIAVALSQSQTKNKERVLVDEGRKKSKNLWIFIGLVSGALPPLQTAINARLRVATGSILKATFISFFVGMLILMGLLLITQKKIEIPRFDKENKKLPIWIYLSGIFGIFILMGNIVLLPKLGSVLTTMVFLLGQMIMALLIDQFGLFKLEKRVIDIRRILTLVLMVVGIAFVKFV